MWFRFGGVVVGVNLVFGVSLPTETSNTVESFVFFGVVPSVQ